MKRKIAGVMGPGDMATDENIELAFEVGKLLADLGYDTLTGGRNCGVMEAAMKGAKSVGGQTIGILPSANDDEISTFADIQIKTGMGQGRNVINILSSDVIIAIGMGPGTSSEISMAIKHGKKVILLSQSEHARNFFTELSDKVILCSNLKELQISL